MINIFQATVMMIIMMISKYKSAKNKMLTDLYCPEKGMLI